MITDSTAMYGCFISMGVVAILCTLFVVIKVLAKGEIESLLSLAYPVATPWLHQSDQLLILTFF